MDSRVEELDREVRDMVWGELSSINAFGVRNLKCSVAPFGYSSQPREVPTSTSTQCRMLGHAGRWVAKAKG